jgi:hypothetical protein
VLTGLTFTRNLFQPVGRRFDSIGFPGPRLLAGWPSLGARVLLGHLF